MSLRTWLYGKLTNAAEGAELQGWIQSRVFAKKSMKSSIEDHPYLIYKLGNATNEDLSEVSTAHRQYFQIYVHDYADMENADYMRIDAVIVALKELLHLASSAADNVIEVRYLETSQDLDDITLGTIFKYVRFVAVVGS